MTQENQTQVLTPDCCAFINALHHKFESKRRELIAARHVRAENLLAVEKLDFLKETESVRQASWQVATTPADLQDRRIEITGPAEAKMIINALNCGAKVFMADLEDALSPTWANLIDGQLALSQAVRRTLVFKNEAGKEYHLNSKTATLVVRPRGLHLMELNYKVDGEPICGSLFDFGVFFFHNVREQLKTGQTPAFYLPKLESHLEARWWNQVFVEAQNLLMIPQGTIRATVLIETILAAFEMEEILFELKDHAAGLNAGRWDYIFSLIKKHCSRPEFMLPDRGQVTMATGFMSAYAELLVQTCHRRGAHAIGGMAAFIPNRKEPLVTENALKKVSEDKAREAGLGFDGSWIAHPDLAPVAQKEFDQVLGTRPHQKDKIPTRKILASELLDLKIAGGQITEAGVRTNISVSLQYVERWLAGLGAVAINNLMEDAATAEISRTQLWQWIHHGAALADGRKMTAELYQTWRDEEHLKIEKSQAAPHLAEAKTLLDELILQKDFTEFLTLKAYPGLLGLPNTQGDHMNEQQLNSDWSTSPRWKGIKRSYTAKEVMKLKTSLPVEYSIARHTSEKLWTAISGTQYVNTFGAMTGAQAVQMVKAGLKAIYLSGWQVAADANLSGQTYPDQSLYPSNSVPAVVRRINNAFQRADQVARTSGATTGPQGADWYAPIVADAEAGFGGPLHAFELMKSMIEAGAAGVHFEDQLAAEKKCGHLAGKVLVPTSTFIRTLQGARLAADVLNVPSVIIARTDALSANLMTSDIDPVDKAFLTGERTPEGYFLINGGLDYAIARALAYAPYADVLWFETSKPDMKEAEEFAKVIHAKYPGKILAYNCSPSFNWKLHLSDEQISQFQKTLGALGYKFQFITLAGWHLLNYHTFDLAKEYAKDGMTAYVELQEQEFASANSGYTAVRHQQEVGTGYFDQVLNLITEGTASTGALKGSTEGDQFLAHH